MLDRLIGGPAFSLRYIMEDTNPNTNDHIYYCAHDKALFAVFECTTITLFELWTIVPIKEIVSAPAFEEINRILKNV